VQEEGRGRGRTSRGVMSGRESIFACTSLPAQCQSTIAIDSKKRVDNSVVAARVVVSSRCEPDA